MGSTWDKSKEQAQPQPWHPKPSECLAPVVLRAPVSPRSQGAKPTAGQATGPPHWAVYQDLVPQNTALNRERSRPHGANCSDPTSVTDRLSPLATLFASLPHTPAPLRWSALILACTAKASCSCSNRAPAQEVHPFQDDSGSAPKKLTARTSRTTLSRPLSVASSSSPASCVSSSTGSAVESDLLQTRCAPAQKVPLGAALLRTALLTARQAGSCLGHPLPDALTLLPAFQS